MTDPVQAQGTSFHHLPPEIKHYVFEFLPLRTLSLAGEVCKEWLTLSSADGIWRKAFFERYFKRFEQCTNSDLVKHCREICEPKIVKCKEETNGTWRDFSKTVFTRPPPPAFINGAVLEREPKISYFSVKYDDPDMASKKWGSIERYSQFLKIDTPTTEINKDNVHITMTTESKGFNESGSCRGAVTIAFLYKDQPYQNFCLKFHATSCTATALQGNVLAIANSNYPDRQLYLIDIKRGCVATKITEPAVLGLFWDGNDLYMELGSHEDYGQYMHEYAKYDFSIRETSQESQTLSANYSIM